MIMASNYTDDLSGHDYQFVETPPDELVCLICTFVAKDPQQLVCCGRVFCRGCLEKQRDYSHACPQCRRPSQSFNDTRSDRNIKALKVKCDNSGKGCVWTGELRSIQEHLNDTCEYTLILCPNKCSSHSKILRKNLEKHLTSKCIRRPYQCAHCDGVGEFQEITTSHLKVCPMIEVACPNSGCDTIVERYLLIEHRAICPFEILICGNQDIGCEEKLCRKDLEHHVENLCSKRLYRCPHCEDIGVYDEITTAHLEECPEMNVPCPNAGCSEHPKRCEVDNHVEECEYEMVGCKYSDIGCELQTFRRDIDEHEDNVHEHFDLAMKTIQKLKKDFGAATETIQSLTKKYDNAMKMFDQISEIFVPVLDKIQKLQENADRSSYTSTIHFKFTNFINRKALSSDFYSKPFYTHPGGYKLTVSVCSGGYGEGKGTHISVFTHLMRGENDDHLQWPFSGKVTIRLLNQLEDKNHHSKAIIFESDHKRGVRVTGFQVRGTGYGFPMFIPHSDLAYNPARNCQYLKNDCLYFRVDTEIHSWLFCS